MDDFIEKLSFYFMVLNGFAFEASPQFGLSVSEQFSSDEIKQIMEAAASYKEKGGEHGES